MLGTTLGVTLVLLFLVRMVGSLRDFLKTAAIVEQLRHSTNWLWLGELRGRGERAGGRGAETSFEVGA